MTTPKEPREILNNWLKRLTETDNDNYPHIIDIDYKDCSDLLSALDSYYKSLYEERMLGEKGLIEIICNEFRHPDFIDDMKNPNISKENLFKTMSKIISQAIIAEQRRKG